MEVVPLAHALGVEIRGVDIIGAVTDADIGAIREVWHRAHVIVFRDVEWTPARHIAFSRRFRDLDDHAATPHDTLDGFPELLEITNIPKNGEPSQTRNTGRNWHSDYSYTNRPAAASMLYCVKKPPVGGDTMFCNMVRAYEDLSDKMKGVVADLQSVYDFSLVSGLGKRDPEKIEELLKINPPIAHPCVREHDESGVKALYVSERTSHFDGMTREESEPLIKFLCTHATRPENVYRHQWRVGDLVCWDNRTTMHLALGDFDESQPRRMLRTTLRGEPSGYVVPPAA
jgi:alpha-ketoglutarate-dependent taurine dioxygenase